MNEGGERHLRKSVIVMTRADLNTIGCSNPACTGDHRIVHLNPSCHPDAGTSVSFDKTAGVRVIECIECQNVICGVQVGTAGERLQ
jgi:hypothetical protein